MNEKQRIKELEKHVAELEARVAQLEATPTRYRHSQYPEMSQKRIDQWLKNYLDVALIETLSQ